MSLFLQKKMIVPLGFVALLVASCGGDTASETPTELNEAEYEYVEDDEFIEEEEGMIINVGELTGEITYTNIDGGPAVTSHFVDINLSRWADRFYELPLLDVDGTITDTYITMDEVKSMTFSGCTREEMDAYFERPEEERTFENIPRVQIEMEYVDGTKEIVETYSSWHCIYYDVQNLEFSMNWCDVQKIEFGPLPWEEEEQEEEVEEHRPAKGKRP